MPRPDPLTVPRLLCAVACIVAIVACDDTVVDPMDSTALDAPPRTGLAPASAATTAPEGLVFLRPTSFSGGIPAGEFSASYLDDLEVRICEPGVGGCADVLTTMSVATPSPAGLRVVDTSSDPEPEDPAAYYMALWDTKGLSAPRDVRVMVSLSGRDLGWTDLRLVQRPRGGRSSGAVKAGSVLPIKFWMDGRWEDGVFDHPLPAPEVEYLGHRIDGDFRRHYFAIRNSAAYAPALFASAPELPPCGTNENASRTWLEIYLDGARRYGYCGLRDLESTLQVATYPSETFPSMLGVELWDRATDRRVRTRVEVDPDLVYGGS